MDKLLIVFNTCGIRRESPSRYVKHIESILKQDFDNFHFAISSCRNSEECIEYLKLKFKKDISYNVIQDKLPISVTFNDTIEKCVKSFGEFDNYMFIDSGIDFEDNSNIFENYQNRIPKDIESMLNNMNSLINKNEASLLTEAEDIVEFVDLFQSEEWSET